MSKMKRVKVSRKMVPSQVLEEDESDEEITDRIHIVDDIYISPPPEDICTRNNTGRLMITHIVNENFKSYSGRQVLGPFHKCFTSIIGPNGSGKSNVIDSMLFVFGYRAKKIRSKKISVLIHSSDEHNDASSCRVDVHFIKIIDSPDKPDEYETVPNSEIVISRTAFRDSSSFYMINNRKVKFKEVSNILRSNGVDLDHNRFLILQGEVEQIATMKRKAQNEHEVGLLEYLEDIIGTNRYKEPLQKLEKSIEDFNQLRSEKLNRVKIVEQEIASLEGPKNEAVKYIKGLNEITLLKNKIYQKNKNDLEKKFAAETERKSDIDNKLLTIQEKLQEISADKLEKQRKMDNITSKLKELEESKNNFKEKHNQTESGYTKVGENITHTLSKRNGHKKILSEEKRKLAELECLPEKNNKEIEELTRIRERLLIEKSKEEAAFEKVMAKSKEGSVNLQDEKRTLQTKLMKLKEDANNCRTDYDTTASELKMFVSREEKEHQKLEQLRRRYDDVKKQLSENKTKLENLNKDIPITKKELKKAQNDLDICRPKFQKVLDDLMLKRQELMEIKSSEQTIKSRGRVIDSLLREKTEGRLQGLYGRLGDLGGIDKKYDVAISTACGALDYIVVDTVTTAERGIEFLKRNNIGRATFIVLEKQEHFKSDCNKKMKTPENVPRLFDLIRMQNENMRTAFYFGLRDTLVATDLEQATRIAYKGPRYRVVTLKGELIETSGTMSGGGATVFRGRMGQQAVSSSFSKKDLEEKEGTVKVLEKEEQELKLKLRTLENTVSGLTEKLSSMENECKRLNIGFKTLTEDEARTKVQLTAQEEVARNTVADPSKVASLNEEMKNKKKKYDEADSKVKELQAEITGINKKISEITEGRPKFAKQKLEEVDKKIDNIDQNIRKLKLGIKTAEKNAQRIHEKISNIEEEITKMQESLCNMKEQQKSFENDAKEYLKHMAEIVEKIVLLNDKKERMEQELKEVLTKEKKLKSNKIDLDIKAQNMIDAIKNIKCKLQDVVQHLNKLKLEEIPDEDDEETEELKTFSSAELDTIDVQWLEERISSIQSDFASTKPNISVIEEYKEKSALFTARVAELDEVTEKRDDRHSVLEEQKRKRLTEFMTGFKTISSKLREIFQMISLGGDAELECADASNPFAEGVTFCVRPLKKTWKDISKLSGGEKTLSSLALVFALHYYKPTPIYVMDEIDAALDFRNVSIVGYYIMQRTRNAQFIIISLRPNMYELANRVIGIYKTHNCTQSVTINREKYGIKSQPLAGRRLQAECESTESVSKLPPTDTRTETCTSAQNHTNMDVDGKDEL